MDLAGLVHRYQRTLLITVMMFKLGKTQLLPPPAAASASTSLRGRSLLPTSFDKLLKETRRYFREPKLFVYSFEGVAVVSGVSGTLRSPADPFFA